MSCYHVLVHLVAIKLTNNND